MVDGQAGKGDKRRPHDYKKWSDNYDAIFGKKDQEVPEPETNEDDNQED